MKIVVKTDAAEIYRQSCRILGKISPALFNYSWFQTLKAIEGKTLEVDTKYLFSDQFNTLPIKGLSENGLRIMADSVDEVIDDIRDNVGCCQFCENRTPGIVSGFCDNCMDSPYLKEDELRKGATRILPVGTKRRKTNWIELTDEEFDKLRPVYVKRQTTGKNSRNAERLRKIRERLVSDCRDKIKTARTNRDGMLWLIDHGIETENCIYYSHTNKFCFGWRQSLAESVKEELKARLVDFPYPVEFK